MTFGRLTVIRRVEDRIGSGGRSEAMWLCECDCEKKTLVTAEGRSLTRKHGIRSCGCISREKVIARNKNGHFNTYNLSGEYGIGWTPKGDVFWFDKEDYELIKDYCWNYDTSTGYLGTTNHIKFHRLVMRVDDPNIIVDHIIHPPRNENKIDNRKSNLRIVNRFQNNINKSVAVNNTSGVPGVSWSKIHNKWMVRIGVEGKRIYLGLFQDFDSAVDARRLAEIKYYGEYRYKFQNTT
jgi:hypothetical protein